MGQAGDMGAGDAIAIEALDCDGFAAALDGLADLLVDAVDGGASVNFLAGVRREETRAWWAAQTGEVRNGTWTVFVGRNGTGRIVGSTVLVRSRKANSPHRAEIVKVLVHRDVRRQGLARRLMAAAEGLAAAEGRWLLLLDTHAGTAADAMYRALGWTPFGTVPNHSLTADGILAPATYFWKDLRPAGPGHG
jgi:GNAT superfamily N-acetyltransferase